MKTKKAQSRQNARCTAGRSRRVGLILSIAMLMVAVLTGGCAARRELCGISERLTLVEDQVSSLNPRAATHFTMIGTREGKLLPLLRTAIQDLEREGNRVVSVSFIQGDEGDMSVDRVLAVVFYRGSEQEEMQ